MARLPLVNQAITLRLLGGQVNASRGSAEKRVHLGQESIQLVMVKPMSGFLKHDCAMVAEGLGLEAL
jgi:hypothetical protein